MGRDALARTRVYPLLLLGVPVLGGLAFVGLVRRMRAAAVPEPPIVRLLAVFAAYGTLLLFAAAAAFDAWSAVHSLAAGLLLAVGAPWLTVQGLVTLVRGVASPYHRAVALLSLAFPAVLVALFLVARVRG